MRKFVLSILCASALLTGCKSLYTPIEIASDDPNMLFGTWQGDVKQYRQPKIIHTTQEYVYLLDGYYLEKRIAKTGKVVWIRKVKEKDGKSFVQWRNDHTIISLIGRVIEVNDSETGQLIKKIELNDKDIPNFSSGYLSKDGAMVFFEDRGKGITLAYSTRTGQRVHLKKPASSLKILSGDTSGMWAIAFDKITEPSVFYAYHYLTGKKILLAAHQLDMSCPNRREYRYSTDIEAIKNENGKHQFVVSYPDGQIHFLDENGKLLHIKEDLKCNEVHFYSSPDQEQTLIYHARRIEKIVSGDLSQDIKRDMEVGVLDVNTKKVIQSYQPSWKNKDDYENVIAHTHGILVETPRADDGNSYQYKGWQHDVWKMEDEEFKIMLDVKSTIQNSSEATVSGTAILNGEEVKVSGICKAGEDSIFKPQVRPFMPELKADLQLKQNGKLIAELFLYNDVATKGSKPKRPDPTVAPIYSVYLRTPTINTARGFLKRP